MRCQQILAPKTATCANRQRRWCMQQQQRRNWWWERSETLRVSHGNYDYGLDYDYGHHRRCKSLQFVPPPLRRPQQQRPQWHSDRSTALGHPRAQDGNACFTSCCCSSVRRYIWTGVLSCDSCHARWPGGRQHHYCHHCDDGAHASNWETARGDYVGRDDSRHCWYVGCVCACETDGFTGTCEPAAQV